MPHPPTPDCNPEPVLFPVQWPDVATASNSAYPQLHALMTTRQGGVSQGVYGQADSGTGGCNLSLNVGDSAEAVAHNRLLLKQTIQRLDRHARAPIFLQQVHGVRVLDLDTANLADLPPADAAITSTPGTVLCIGVADCLPVLFDAGNVLGAAHAGWRGLANGVLAQTVQALQRKSQLPPKDWRVWLGPCISRRHFEVGQEVWQAFAEEGEPQTFGEHPEAGKYWCDLPQLARLRLERLGLQQIRSAEVCTYQARERFYSYRRDGVCGRQVACAWLAAS